MKKIMFCIGTRPEAIKVIPVISAFLEDKTFEVVVCLTGQHREMLYSVLEDFEIKYDFNLDVMSHDQSLAGTTSSIITGLDKLLKKIKPDLLFVHGDTNTTFSSTLSAFYNNIKVAHIEAGLRTYRTDNPWPEEIFRQLTARIAHVHLPPTKDAETNLIHENLNHNNIIVTGNTVIDALNLCIKKIQNRPILKERILEYYRNFNIDLKKYHNNIILITGHRRENRGDGIINLCEAIDRLATNFSDNCFVFPVHLSPHVKKVVFDYFSLKPFDNVFLLPPIDYTNFVYLMSVSKLIITDSGGIQEEAPTFKVPVLVTRSTSERLEAVDKGAVKLIGNNADRIFEETAKLLTSQIEYNKMQIDSNPYGDGHASKRIVKYIKTIL